MNSKAVLTRLALGVVSLLFLARCGGSGGSTNQPPPPTIPTITGISPNSAAAGGADFTLMINGTNFVAASMVKFGGMAATTTFVNATQLTAAVPAGAIASVGMVSVTVTNPEGTSNPVFFTITAISIPAINSLSPNCATVGGPAFTLLAIGSNFVSTSVLRWNGSDRPTAFTDNQEIQAQISASDIAAPGTAAVTVFTPGGGTSNSLNFTVAAGGVGPQSIAIDPTGKFAYVVSEGCGPGSVGNVSMYSVDSSTGALVRMGIVAAGTFPKSVAVDPFGKFAYVANNGSGPGTASVSMYTIDGATGALTPIGVVSESCPTELCSASSVTVHHSGKFAYVGDGIPGDNVSMFSIDLITGALTFIGTVATASPNGSIATAIAIDPIGEFAYAVGDNCASDTFDSEVSVYIISHSTGALSSTGSPVPAGVCPSSVAVDPLGRFAYVTNDSGLNGHQDDNVATYTINGTTGALTFIGVAGTGMGPSFVAIDPTGKFAYVTNFLSNDVAMYTINATTGMLTSIGTIAAGLSPTSIAIHGKFAYVTNSGSNNVSMYSIDAVTGALTLIGTVGT